MTIDTYDKLSEGERLIYDEHLSFQKALMARVDALTQAIQKLLEVATTDP